VRSPELERLGGVLTHRGLPFDRSGTDALVVEGASGEEIGMAAFEARIPLSELAPLSGSLEDAFLAITGEGAAAPPPPVSATPERPA
jgi:ABC-2 type transport system ATP-binding protein